MFSCTKNDYRGQIGKSKCCCYISKRRNRPSQRKLQNWWDWIVISEIMTAHDRKLRNPNGLLISEKRLMIKMGNTPISERQNTIDKTTRRILRGIRPIAVQPSIHVGRPPQLCSIARHLFEFWPSDEPLTHCVPYWAWHRTWELEYLE